MFIPVNDFINYIKFQLSQENNTDPVVATIKDEDIESLIKIHCGTVGLEFPQVPYSYMAIMSCLIRKELYWKLATYNANNTELETDGTHLNKHQRFEHYMSLIYQVDKEYEAIMSDPSRLPEGFNGGSAIKVSNVIVNKTYNIREYVNNYKIPKVKLSVDNVTDKGVELSLDLSKVNKSDYISTTLYLNDTSKILDEYSGESNLSKGTKQVYQTYDIHKDKVRIPCTIDLESTPKHILLVIELKYNIKAYAEIEVTL